MKTLNHRPEIAEAAVVGLPSERWGQKVAAVVVLNPNATSFTQQGADNDSRGKAKPKSWGMMDLRRALRDRLAMHKLPQELRILSEPIPRNAMGKGTFPSLFLSYLYRIY